jgi:hypothetical protein
MVTGNTILGVGVGWARVEAGVHYPSVSLVGMALGNLLASFIHDALMNLPQDNDIDVAFFPTEEGVGLTLSFAF